jgi:hypothetical protein
MTSPTVRWVPRLGVTDMWGQVNGQHLTGQRSTRVGSKLGRLGSGWAGLGRAGPNTWRAVAQPRHGHGLLLGFAHSTAHTVWLTVDQKAPVHGPLIGLRWTRSTLPSFSLWSMCTGCTRGLPARGVFPCFSRGCAFAGGELAGEPRGGAGVQLGRGKASPGHGDYVGGVEVAARASQDAGHGERRLELDDVREWHGKWR